MTSCRLFAAFTVAAVVAIMASPATVAARDEEVGSLAQLEFAFTNTANDFAEEIGQSLACGIMRLALRDEGLQCVGTTSYNPYQLCKDSGDCQDGTRSPACVECVMLCNDYCQLPTSSECLRCGAGTSNPAAYPGCEYCDGEEDCSARCLGMCKSSCLDDPSGVACQHCESGASFPRCDPGCEAGSDNAECDSCNWTCLLVCAAAPDDAYCFECAVADAMAAANNTSNAGNAHRTLHGNPHGSSHGGNAHGGNPHANPHASLRGIHGGGNSAMDVPSMAGVVFDSNIAASGINPAAYMALQYVSGGPDAYILASSAIEDLSQGIDSPSTLFEVLATEGFDSFQSSLDLMMEQLAITQPNLLPQEAASLSGGGGFGWGAQLLCDNSTVLLSTGAGFGGGFTQVASSAGSSAGFGGGGGLQAGSYAFGGGCGGPTVRTGDEFEGACVTGTDPNQSTPASLNELWASVEVAALECLARNQLSVSYGGGGGGGILASSGAGAPASLTFGGGYGFSGTVIPQHRFTAKQADANSSSAKERVVVDMSAMSVGSVNGAAIGTVATNCRAKCMTSSESSFYSGCFCPCAKSGWEGLGQLWAATINCDYN